MNLSLIHIYTYIGAVMFLLSQNFNTNLVMELHRLILESHVFKKWLFDATDNKLGWGSSKEHFPKV
jgi:hypothetical protein